MDRTENRVDEDVIALVAESLRRQLGTNADRFIELESELDSDGEEVIKPEVDLSMFLEMQRL
ncbi:hypothetical protein OF83DRAFT_1178488 [Amylostereum chailletii]|nr:hypothetical protein OF83DRAFT_1178488 [Amylostereum chailletii]